jgi:peptidoglycan/LPS O-acetylase OafA/YrhL
LWRKSRLSGDSLTSVASLPQVQSGQANKPSKLEALTGLRCFAAINLLFFHFSNPQWFGWFNPIVNAGFISVSYFILLSGFVLAYNYAERGQRGELNPGRFWKARVARLYPVYLLSLLLSWEMLPSELQAHTPTMFWIGLALTPLLLQGWIPELTTFLNTPAWTMSAEAFFYGMFPWLARWTPPRRTRAVLAILLGLWFLGMIAPILYCILLPDGDPHPGRYTGGYWMRMLKFTPLPHLASFVFGVVLAEIDRRIPRESDLRLFMGSLGFAGLYCVMIYQEHLPYPLLHDGLLMPLFGILILGLAGENLLSKIVGFRLFVIIGESSYCLYLLHFNLWTLLHQSRLLERTGLDHWDPWVSYIIIIVTAIATLRLIERPMQLKLRTLLHG